ncbi:hypothetical protein niasHT_002820 [Heterodera trifolii]|uniref:Phosphoglycerate mutase n=1 Tax=Heterodera trifolii TaxID=157864 RepID=A0ABD2MCA7_9BILA
MVLRAQNITIGRYFLANFFNGGNQQQLEIHDTSKFLYKYDDYANSLNLIEKELKKVHFKWSDVKDINFNDFWTVDQRPNIVQTLYLIRHGQRLDNIKEIGGAWKKKLESEKDVPLSEISKKEVPLSEISKKEVPLSEISDQDVPLTKHGFKQAKELGEWFKSIPIDQVYSSPFQRTLDTANAILEGRNDGIYLNIEPGLTEASF